MAVVVLDDNPVKELDDIRTPPCEGSCSDSEGTVIVKEQ